METVQFIQSLKAQLPKTLIESEMSEASKVILIGHGDIDRYYDRMQAKYTRASIKTMIDSCTHAAPFTNKHLGMLKYLTDTVGFSVALSAIDDLKPFNYSMRSLRQVVARYKGRTQECSLLEFMYDYSSVFCLRGNNYDQVFIDSQVMKLKMLGTKHKRVSDNVASKIIETWRTAPIKPSYLELAIMCSVSKATAYRVVKKYLQSLMDEMTTHDMQIIMQQYHKHPDINLVALATGKSYNQVYAVLHDTPSFKK